MQTEMLKAVIGITNKAKNGFFIPFLDYDNIPLDLVHIDLKHIQEHFKLGHAFIISSTNGFNCFFLDKLTFKECLDILLYSEYVDKKYYEFAVKRNNFTLRLGKDKNFVGFIENKQPMPIHTLSLSHYNFFCFIFNRDIFFSPFQDYAKNSYVFDDSETIQFVEFANKKYGFLDVDYKKVE